MNLGFGKNRKSPTLARILSIIPGLGHLYAGEYLAGIIWLIVSFPIMFMLGIPQMFIYGFSAFRPIMFFLIGYGFLVIWCSREASKIVAEQNGRKAAQAEFTNKKREKAEFERLKEEARKNIYQ